MYNQQNIIIKNPTSPNITKIVGEKVNVSDALSLRGDEVGIKVGLKVIISNFKN
jgi:hypothetical protein